MKETVFTKNAPAPIGPYSQAVKAGNMMFISGQIPLTAEGKLAGDDVITQTHQCLKNLKAILEEAGCTMNDVVKTTVLMQDLGDFAKMNEVYGEYLGDSKPARAAFQVARLPMDVLVEIEAVAIVK